MKAGDAKLPGYSADQAPGQRGRRQPGATSARRTFSLRRLTQTSKDDTMFRHTPRTAAHTRGASWQGDSASHTQLAEATITVAVIAYFASFLLAQLMFV